MKITLTLKEAFDKCNNITYFCKKEGWSEWAVTEGGGHVEITLTEEKAIEYGIIKVKK